MGGVSTDGELTGAKSTIEIKSRKPQSRTLNSNPDADLRMDRSPNLRYLPPRGDPHWEPNNRIGDITMQRNPLTSTF